MVRSANTKKILDDLNYVTPSLFDNDSGIKLMFSAKSHKHFPNLRSTNDQCKVKLT